MARREWVLTGVVLILAGIGLRGEAQTFPDPAPPKVQTLAEIPPPKPQPQEGLRFHTAPRPLAAGAVTHDWKSFLGPTHNALSTETPLRKPFGKNGPPLVWEVTKGEGYASPAVVGDRVILFHRLGQQEVIECLQAETGKRFWKNAYPTAYVDRYGFNGGPRCPPVSDGQSVYTLGVEGKLTCLKLTTGQIVWKRDLLREFKVRQNFFGVGATPLLEGDRLIVTIGAEGGPCVTAFDKRTGKMVWGAGKEWSAGYASPIPAVVQGRRRVFVFTGGESRPPQWRPVMPGPCYRQGRFPLSLARAALRIGQCLVPGCGGQPGLYLRMLWAGRGATGDQARRLLPACLEQHGPGHALYDRRL